MDSPTSADNLERSLDRLRSRDLSELGFEARIRHEKRLETLEAAYQRALDRQADVPTIPVELPAVSVPVNPS